MNSSTNPLIPMVDDDVSGTNTLRKNSLMAYREGKRIYDQAKQSAKQCDWIEALAQFKVAVELLEAISLRTPDDERALKLCRSYLANVYFQIGNMEKDNLEVAAKKIRLGLEQLDPNSSNSHYSHYSKILSDIEAKLLIINSEKQITRIGDYNGLIYEFHQIKNNGVDRHQRANSCGIMAIGVDAEDLKQFFQDASDESLMKAFQIIFDQIDADHNERIGAPSTRISLSSKYADKVQELFTSYQNASGNRSEVIKKYSEKYGCLQNGLGQLPGELIQTIREAKEVDEEGIQQIRVAEENFKKAYIEYVEYLKKPDLLRDYLIREVDNRYVGSTILLAWAKMVDRGLRIWHETSFNILKYIPEQSNENQKDIIHIVHTSNFTHFERLKPLSANPVYYGLHLRLQYQESVIALRHAYNKAKELESNAKLPECVSILQAALSTVSLPEKTADLPTAELTFLINECKHKKNVVEEVLKLIATDKSYLENIISEVDFQGFWNLWNRFESHELKKQALEINLNTLITYLVSTTSQDEFYDILSKGKHFEAYLQKLNLVGFEEQIMKYQIAQEFKWPGKKTHHTYYAESFNFYEKLVLGNCFNDEAKNQTQKLWMKLQRDKGIGAIDKVILWDSFINKIAAISTDIANRLVSKAHEMYLASDLRIFKPITPVSSEGMEASEYEQKNGSNYTQNQTVGIKRPHSTK